MIERVISYAFEIDVLVCEGIFHRDAKVIVKKPQGADINAAIIGIECADIVNVCRVVLEQRQSAVILIS